MLTYVGGAVWLNVSGDQSGGRIGAGERVLSRLLWSKGCSISDRETNSTERRQATRLVAQALIAWWQRSLTGSAMELLRLGLSLQTAGSVRCLRSPCLSAGRKSLPRLIFWKGSYLNDRIHDKSRPTGPEMTPVRRRALL
jgi:hypothetical protein